MSLCHVKTGSPGTQLYTTLFCIVKFVATDQNLFFYVLKACCNGFQNSRCIKGLKRYTRERSHIPSVYTGTLTVSSKECKVSQKPSHETPMARGISSAEC